MKKPSSVTVNDRMIFLKLPENIDSINTFNAMLKNNSFNLVLDTKYNILSVSKTHNISSMFNIDLELMLNKNLTDLRKENIDQAVLNIFINLIENVGEKNKFNGFIMEKNDKKYIVCAYPIVGKENTTVGIYVIKHNYTHGLFMNDFFDNTELLVDT